MTVLRAQCSVRMDTTAPTDVAQINPHFNVSGPTNAQQLATDLALALKSWVTLTTEIRVTMYDAEGPPPHYPLGEALQNPGVAAGTSINRDVALVLSYWAGQNRPRRRGRLYAPCAVLGITPNAANASTTVMNKVAALVPILTALGGANVDWGIWSRVDKAFHSATNWSVNNAWDTQRRRGNTATASVTGTTSESGFPRLAVAQRGYGSPDLEQLQAEFEREWQPFAVDSGAGAAT